ncbi:uncharacterized protein LOC108675166 [Hyalella azteca]|uniref:Uncharacterized protein LOC108675166 n=1 Tax=Hyalella azteca TaxID=294128 RepID=A0A8B7NY60_HYAAZ|nr:uncharacterized protein LOC108675166 [Hyalella azteca]
MELGADKTSNVFERNWQLLKNAATAARADKKFWQQILLSCPRNQEVAAETARHYIAHSKTWQIISGRDVDTIALLLPHQQPSTLIVHRFDGLALVSWRKVVNKFSGNVMLCLPNHHPCDGYIAALSHSSCTLSTFFGRIVESSSIQSLAKVSTPDAEFTIVTEPHVDLAPLQDKHHELWVTVEPTCKGEIVALPVSPRICLKVTPVTENQQESLTRTTLGLAPADNRLRRLEVRDCELAEAQLLEVVAVIQSKGLRTLVRDNEVHGGPSRVLTIREKNFVLVLTDKPPVSPKVESNRLVASKDFAVGGENLCPLASSCGDLDAVYRSLYALNVVLPHALRFVMEKVCADKPPQDACMEYLAQKAQMSLKDLREYVNSENIERTTWVHFEKHECDEIDLRPFDPLIPMSLVTDFMEIRQMTIMDEPDKERNYREVQDLLKEGEVCREEILTNQYSDPSKLVSVTQKMTQIIFKLISEASKLHGVPDAESEQVTKTCQSLFDKYDSAVRVDANAFVAYHVQKENRERRASLASGKEFDDRKFFKKERGSHRINSLGSIKCQVLVIEEVLGSDEINFIRRRAWDNTYSSSHGVFIYFRCLDTQTYSFSDLLKQNFPRACCEIGEKKVGNALTKLNPLILVDGYDEANGMSIVLVEEIFYKLYKFESKIVLTTRSCDTSLIRKIVMNEGKNATVGGAKLPPMNTWMNSWRSCFGV